MTKKALIALTAVLCACMTACGKGNIPRVDTVTTTTTTEATTAPPAETTTTAPSTTAAPAETTKKAEGPAEDKKDGLDYLVLVNKQNKLPEDWEGKVDIVHMTNSLGDDVAVEKKAYDAYLELKAALEKEDVHVDLDSAYRSVAEQEDIVVRFTEKYGEDYVKKYVAVPGFSEHHTGLALDLYLNIDGNDVYLNEDMVQYPEVWEKIHKKLADYGFILRYTEGKEQITGYDYEPWHIRYVGSADTAKEMTKRGSTLEEYLGKVVFTAEESGSGALYADTQHEVDSPEWVTALAEAQDENTKQLFVVGALGMDLTTATVSMHERSDDGSWKQVLSSPAYVGKNGMIEDEERKEGCGRTPIGTYRFTAAFGIADDPGCAIPYTKVDDDIYWSGDQREGMHYNEMVNINDYPDLDTDECEHIIEYEYPYRYCLNIGFNEEGTPGRGSAIFLHCLGTAKPYTGGCVSVPENIMKLIMQRVDPECVVVIGLFDEMGGTF